MNILPHPLVSINKASSMASNTQSTPDKLIIFLPHSHYIRRHICFGMFTQMLFPSISRSSSSYCYSCFRVACNFNKSLYSEFPLGSHPPSLGSGFIAKHFSSFRERAGGSKTFSLKAVRRGKTHGASGACRGGGPCTVDP